MCSRSNRGVLPLCSGRLLFLPGGFLSGGWSLFALCFGALLLWAIPGSSSATSIYTYVDKEGVVHLTDRPRNKRYRRLIDKTGRFSGRTPVLRGGRGYRPSKPRAYSSKKYKKLISLAARRYRLDSALVQAVIQVESAFNPNAISHAGAVGLMQLMPKTARQYGVTNRRDPVANVLAGTRHLRYLLDLYKNDLLLSLAAYNAGEGAVQKYGNKIPPYKETIGYVKKVLRYYRKFRKS